MVRNAPSLDPDEPAHLAQLRKEANARFYGESAVAFYNDELAGAAGRLC